MIDGEYFWARSEKEIKFSGIQVKSLQLYLNADLGKNMLAFMIKPLAFGQHIVSQSALYQAEYDLSSSTMLFAKKGEISCDFPVRNWGILADIAYTRSINQALSFFAKCPVEYRQITTDSTRYVSARFSYGRDPYSGYYTRYVQVDAFGIDPFDTYNYFFSPHIGLRFDSRANLAWPFIFLPFVAQHGSLECYFTGRYEGEWEFWHKEYGLDKFFGCAYETFQNICFNGRFFTGMENMLSLGIDGLSMGGYSSANLYAEFTPQLKLKNNFFLSGPRLGVSFEFDRDYWGYDGFVNNDLKAGFGYMGNNWGFSFNVNFMDGFESDKYLESLEFLVWRAWK